MNTCKCGCGNTLKDFYYKNVEKIKPLYFKLHSPNRKGKFKDTINRNTMYERSKEVLKPNCCKFDYIGQCKGRFEVHHLDENITNNNIDNLLNVCTSHHRLIHKGKFDIKNPTALYFKVDSCGKRRYGTI